MKTLLFDIDGTLLLTNNSGSGALKESIETEFGIADASVAIDFAGRTDRSILVELLQSNDLEPSGENQAKLRAHYVGRLPQVLEQSGGQILPGVVDLLQELSASSRYRCCVMTGNLVVTAGVKLGHFNLHGYFEKIYGGDHDEHRNDLAKRAAKQIRSDFGEEALQDVVVIGDTVADIQCGHAIGADVIAVATGSHSTDRLAEQRPLAVMDDLSDRQQFIGLIESV